MSSSWRRSVQPLRQWAASSRGGSGVDAGSALDQDSRDAESFLLRLARALHVYGTGAHRLEEALVSLAEFFGLEAEFLVSPTSVSVSYGSLEQQRTHLLRVDAGESDLSKLAALHEVISEVVEGRLDARAARARVLEITESPARFPRRAMVLGFALSSGSVARIFDGGVAEIALSTAIGLLVGAVAVGAGGNPRLRQLVPALAGLLAAAGAYVVADRLPLYAPVVILSSLIVLVPGLSMTLAMSELASGHVVSGTSRLVSTLVTFLQLGFGVALGTKLVALGGELATSASPHSLPPWTLPVAVVPMAVSLVMLFQARWRDLSLILPVLVVSYFGTRLGAEVLGPELGAAVGALSLGISSNALARWRDVPTAIPLVPGLLPLVPGSLGLSSLQAILANDVMNGVESATSVSLIAIGLVSGLFLANLLVTPRRLL